MYGGVITKKSMKCYWVDYPRMPSELNHSNRAISGRHIFQAKIFFKFKDTQQKIPGLHLVQFVHFVNVAIEKHGRLSLGIQSQQNRYRHG